MKKTLRLLGLTLAVLSLLALASVAMAADVTAYIPGRVTKLDLPEYDEGYFGDYTYDGDVFQTGQEGGRTTVYWEEVTVAGHKFVMEDGVKVEKYAEYDTLYIPQVRVVYPEGNYIRKIVARYRNDAARSLIDYLITYETSETEKYTIRYAASNATILETHDYDVTLTGEKKLRHITFQKWDGKPIAKPTATQKQFLHRYYQDQILEGWYECKGQERLKSGSGKNYKQWFLWDYYTGSVTKSHKRGLKPITAFPSPRVQ